MITLNFIELDTFVVGSVAPTSKAKTPTSSGSVVKIYTYSNPFVAARVIDFGSVELSVIFML